VEFGKDRYPRSNSLKKGEVSDQIKEILMKLTDTFVKRKLGNGKAQKHADGGGLFLYVSPAGSKSWRMAYRFLGKHKLLVIGPYPTISLKEARERRDAAKRLLLDNIDPSTAKQEAKAAAAVAARNSFEAVAREWVGRYSADWSETYKGHIMHRLEDMIFPVVGKRPIKNITAQELLGALRKIEDRGAICVAHLALRECGRIFRYAVATGKADRDIAHDLRGAITPMRATRHFAAVTDARAIGKLLCSLDDVSKHTSFPMRCALRLAPLVFVRAKELAGAEWAHIDLEAKEWRVPPEMMKMRQMHIVPLSRQAVAILRELHAVTGRYRHLFPGRPKVAKDKDKTKGDVPMRSISLVNALRRLGYSKEEMTFHGFRSMASTVLNEKGYNRDWIERQLAHCERSGVRASYNHAEYLQERRRMMQDWADHLTELKEKAKTRQKNF
jgi:integrase